MDNAQPTEAEIDRLRLVAFATNSLIDRNAYLEAAAKWFNNRHYRDKAYAEQLDHWRHEVGKLHSQSDRLRARIAQLEAVVAAGDGLAEAAKLHGYLDGYAAATADVEVMRATDGVLAGQSLIVSALKIGLTKMRSSLAIPTPPASPEVAALVDAGKPLLDMALWTESAADGEIVIMTVGTIRKLRTALSALEAKP